MSCLHLAHDMLSQFQGVELELTKLEAAVHAIHENLLYLRSRYS